MTPEELIESWYAATPKNSPDEALTHTLWRIVEDHPEWFNAELTGDPLQMLLEAIAEAQDDMRIIEAAYLLIKSNPDWLSDTPQPEPEPEPMPLTVSEPEPMPLTVSEPIAELLRGIGQRLDAGQEVVFLSSGEAYAAGAKAQREADHTHLMSRGESFPAGMLHNRPLVTDDDTTTVTSGKEAAARIQYAAGYDIGYAEGRDAGYAEGRDAGYDEGRDYGYDLGHADGYRASVLRFADGETR